MLVIHPADPTTDFLRVLYEGREGCRCLLGEESRNQVNGLLFHLPPGEPVMLLGHGSDAGLFRGQSRYVGRSMAFCLRRHPVIGIWCHANRFSEALGLSGLFSATTEKELERENLFFASALAGFLNAGLTYPEIVARMREAAGIGPAVRMFNFNSLYAI